MIIRISSNHNLVLCVGMFSTKDIRQDEKTQLCSLNDMLVQWGDVPR